MADTALYNLNELLDEILTKADKLSDKEITLQVLKGKSYLEIAEKLEEKTAAEVKQIVISTLRRAIKNSPEHADAKLFKSQWVKLVESL